MTEEGHLLLELLYVGVLYFLCMQVHGGMFVCPYTYVYMYVCLCFVCAFRAALIISSHIYDFLSTCHCSCKYFGFDSDFDEFRWFLCTFIMHFWLRILIFCCVWMLFKAFNLLEDMHVKIAIQGAVREFERTLCMKGLFKLWSLTLQLCFNHLLTRLLK